MKDYFIIERTKPDMKEYLSTLAEDGAYGWRPTPENAYQFPSAVLAEVQRQDLTAHSPGYKYQLFQVRMSIFPVEVKIESVASKRGGGTF